MTPIVMAASAKLNTANDQAACPSNFVPITGPVVDKLIAAYPFYARGSIPTESYGISADVPTFGSRATLVTLASAYARVVAVMLIPLDVAHLSGMISPTVPI
jgi:TRAP-type uncharacterized transport system substrate-binding protein